jgi:hypothetical protein
MPKKAVRKVTPAAGPHIVSVEQLPHNATTPQRQQEVRTAGDIPGQRLRASTSLMVRTLGLGGVH